MEYSDKTTEALQLLKRMVSIPSVSREEDGVACLIEETLRGKGYNVERLGNNNWVMSRHWKRGLPVVLLDSHIDTVKPVAAWKHDPFTPTETEDGMVYGLGANDDGASVVSLMQSFLAIDSMGGSSDYNLVYLASCEEEVSGKNGIESVLPHLPEVSFAVVGEPTGMQPAIAEKGLMVIDVTEEGVAGHAARQGGVNAIYKAVDDIEWIRSHQFDRVSPLLGPVKMTVTIIDAGTQHNVIPDKCTFTIDVRSNELYSNQELFDEINQKLQGDAKARSFRLNSSRIDMEHPFVKKLLGMGLTPFGSPTLSNQALMSFPSVKIGPGDSSRSHSADEFIKIAEIDDAIRKYCQLLK